MVRIKICGITNAEDASAAVECGADALGFVFYQKSPRRVSPETARSIIELLPPFLTTVGVFVNESAETINAVKAESGIDMVQLHGDESPAFCKQWSHVIKAFRVAAMSDLAAFEQYTASAFLLDAYSPVKYGGTGQVFNWEIAIEAKRYGSIILAGGLTADNIAKAVTQVRPYAVDVSSGVERAKGKKDPIKLRLFIERARAAAR